MLAKKTSKNQITLPAVIVRQFPDVDYFYVSSEGDRIVLKPLRPSRADEVREKLRELRISQQDVDEAVDWARHGR